MPADKSNQIKTYVVIGLSVVFLLVGYFTFVHKKVPHNAGPTFSTPSTAPIARLEVPKVEAKTLPNPEPAKVPVSEPLREDLTDIFAPLKSPVKKESQPEGPEPPKPVPSFKLLGTIVGGKRPIAIINDQFARTGDWIGEYRVISIGKKGVLLDSGTIKIRLTMVEK
jgi:hypothetical protein